IPNGQRSSGLMRPRDKVIGGRLTHRGTVVISSVLSPWKPNMPDPKSDAEILMNAALPFAEKMLAEHSAFFPYGAAMKDNGEIVNVAGYDGQQHPPAQEIIDLLYTELRKDASKGTYKATAIVYDVRVTPPGKTAITDAIAIALEHRENYSAIVVFPYSR